MASLCELDGGYSSNITMKFDDLQRNSQADLCLALGSFSMIINCSTEK